MQSSFDSKYDFSFRPESYWTDRPNERLLRENDEIAIVRVTLMSVMGDVTEIRAGRVGDRIMYRVEDEYDSDYVVHPESSQEPLTFGELVDLIDTSVMGGERDNPFAVSVVWGPLEGHVDSADRDELLSLVSLHSDIYPDLGPYYDERIVAWIDERLGDR